MTETVELKTKKEKTLLWGYKIVKRVVSRDVGFIVRRVQRGFTVCIVTIELFRVFTRFMLGSSSVFLSVSLLDGGGRNKDRLCFIFGTKVIFFFE